MWKKNKASAAPVSPSNEQKEKITVYQERPQICLIDIDAKAEENLRAAGFNCGAGSFGSPVKFSDSKTHLLKVDNDLPHNLHEFDIVVIDLKDRAPLDYSSQLEISTGTSADGVFIVCEYPQTIFDPRPFSGEVAKDDLTDITQRSSIFIIFGSSPKQIEYQFVTMRSSGYTRDRKINLSNYGFLPFGINPANRKGNATEVVEGFALSDILKRYNPDFSYEAVFEHPYKYVDGRSVQDEDFIPLIRNMDNGIVSFAQVINSNIALVFPQLKDKKAFLLDLFRTYLPEIKPELFPFSTKFAWLKSEEYRLPGEANLVAQRATLKKEYESRIEAIELAIEENKVKHSFLHNLLKGTGTELVKATEQYFYWLGFDKIENLEENRPQLNEEDLRITLEHGLLVVEVKGISGTSKDSECSQISKIRRRREKERSAHDVSALYIVNHQRYFPPENRTNPPFTKTQITDAESDERGLLTTYDLFKLYFCVEAGIVTKEDARSALLNYGLVTFKPSNSDSLGYPRELYRNNTVGIFELNDMTVRVGDELIIFEQGKYGKVRIEGIQDHNKSVDEASKGEIGFKFSDPIKKSSEVWKPKT
jgi:hypothetical protein